MKKLILLALIIQLPAHAYYDKYSDYSNYSKTYDEYALGAPSHAHETSLPGVVEVIHFPTQIKQNQTTTAYPEGTPQAKQVIIRKNTMEVQE